MTSNQVRGRTVVSALLVSVMLAVWALAATALLDRSRSTGPSPAASGSPPESVAVAGGAVVAGAAATDSMVRGARRGDGPDPALSPVSAVAAAPPPASPPGMLVRVVDEMQRPLPGAVVHGIDGERDLWTLRSDADGSVIVPMRTTCIRGARAGHWPATLRLDGGTCPVLCLPQAPTLRGRVFAPDGWPCGAARLALLPAIAGRLAFPASMPPSSTVATSASDGMFAMPWPDASRHDLVVRASGTAGAVVPAICASTERAHEVTVLLRPAARLEVGLVGASARFGQRVEVWSQGEPGESAPLGPPGAPRSGQLLASTTIDGSCRCVFEELPAGIVYVVWPERGVQRLQTLAPWTTTVVALREDTPARIHGTVSASSPASTVFLFGGAVHTHMRRPAGDGSFAFENVPPGRYLLGAHACADVLAMHRMIQDHLVYGRSEQARLLTLRAGDEIVVHLDGSAPVHGCLEGTAFVGGQVAADHVVALVGLPDVGARARQARTDAGGSFRFGDLPCGDYELRLLTTAGPAAGASIRVRDASTLAVVLTAP